MVKVTFPSLWIPALKFEKSQFLDISLLGVGIKVPPVDITFWEAIKLTPEFTIIDTDWIINPISTLMLAIPQAVWDLLTSTLENLVNEYYEDHPEEKP